MSIFDALPVTPGAPGVVVECRTVAQFVYMAEQIGCPWMGAAAPRAGDWVAKGDVMVLYQPEYDREARVPGNVLPLSPRDEIALRLFVSCWGEDIDFKDDADAVARAYEGADAFLAARAKEAR